MIHLPFAVPAARRLRICSNRRPYNAAIKGVWRHPDARPLRPDDAATVYRCPNCGLDVAQDATSRQAHGVEFSVVEPLDERSMSWARRLRLTYSVVGTTALLFLIQLSSVSTQSWKSTLGAILLSGALPLLVCAVFIIDSQIQLRYRTYNGDFWEMRTAISGTLLAVLGIFFTIASISWIAAAAFVVASAAGFLLALSFDHEQQDLKESGVTYEKLVERETAKTVVSTRK